MTDYLRTPDTPADTLRDTLLGALVGLARSTSSEPKTENTDAVLNAGLRLAAQPDAPAETLQRMLDITRAEKHAVAPNCATCAMPCGNTKDYDLTRLRSAAHRTTEHKQNTQKTLLQNSCRSVLFCAWMPCYFFALPQRNFRFCSGSGSGISNT